MTTASNIHADSDVLTRTLRRERAARKRAEQLLEDKSRELYQAQDELRKQYDSLAETQLQLVQSEKMASVGQLSAGIAHEINNPIGFVTSNVSTLADYVDVLSDLVQRYDRVVQAVAQGDANASSQELEEIARIREAEEIDYLLGDCRKLLDESLDGLRRVREIVQSLKSFVRLEQEADQDVDLRDGIEATLRVVWNELKYKCTVDKQLHAIPHVRCHPGEINQVFMNLLVNAGQAIDKQGTVRITTSSTEAHVVVSISDDGCGIPEENLSKLFTPFFTTKPVGSGTGLGLSVSYGIVEKHGGTIEVSSTVGEGTTFIVKLPISPTMSAE
ncbi:MAG: hypothetical protein KDA99_11840 [Planctomycetales bacterium]|nr:hypothetical protein [Planctomycetales bacterium]